MLRGQGRQAGAWRATTLAAWLALLLCCSRAIEATSTPQLPQRQQPQPQQPQQPQQRQLGSRLSDQLLRRYLTNEQLEAWMDEFAHKCGHITRKFSIGRSFFGAQLWVLEVSDKPGVPEPEPNFKYVGNMHGDEPSGRVLLAQLAEWLCAHYGSDERATRLVRDVHTYILPSMNPDGFARSTRANGMGADLNRDFPDPVENDWDAGQMATPPDWAQVETAAMMEWTLETPFAASANLHEGAVVANYPYDGYPDHSQAERRTPSPCPDDAAFRHLARTYASKHTWMSGPRGRFAGGITNGAQWYPLYGGMQDWNYLVGKCMAITLELSDDKWRPEADLPTLWEENREALVELPLVATLGGVRGTVVSASDASAGLAAVISVQGIPWNTSAHPPFGYFSRPLAPGTYTVRASRAGFRPEAAEVTVPKDGSGAVVQFRLQPLSGEDMVAAAPGAAARREALGRLRRNGVAMAAVGAALCLVGILAVVLVCQGPRWMQQHVSRATVV